VVGTTEIIEHVKKVKIKIFDNFLIIYEKFHCVKCNNIHRTSDQNIKWQSAPDVNIVTLQLIKLVSVF